VVATGIVLSPLVLDSLAAGTPAVDPPAVERRDDGEPIQPLPPAPALDARQVALGRRLFGDKRLSADRSVACTSCHDLSAGGADTLRTSKGVGGVQTLVNTPTIFNLAFNSRVNWSGTYATLDAHMADLSANPIVMKASWEGVAKELRDDPAYAAAFREAFPEGLTPASLRAALVAFERSMVTPNAPFDRYLAGQKDALPEEAQEGYRLFKAYGCSSCHQGVNVGGNMFQTFGVMGSFFEERGTPETDADQGRFNVTKKESDRHVFRVPSLRNVARTAPYFHDGSAPTLGSAIAVMARYQLGRSLTSREIASLVAFLTSLNGETPKGGA